MWFHVTGLTSGWPTTCATDWDDTSIKRIYRWSISCESWYIYHIMATTWVDKIYKLVGTLQWIPYFMGFYFDGLVQDCSNSSALAMELPQSCTKPSIYYFYRIFLFICKTHLITFHKVTLFMWWCETACQNMNYSIWINPCNLIKVQLKYLLNYYSIFDSSGVKISELALMIFVVSLLHSVCPNMLYIQTIKYRL